MGAPPQLHHSHASNGPILLILLFIYIYFSLNTILLHMSDSNWKAVGLQTLPGDSTTRVLPVELSKRRCFEDTPAHQVNFRPLVAKLSESRRASINIVVWVSVLYHFLTHILIRTVLDPCVVLPVFQLTAPVNAQWGVMLTFLTLWPDVPLMHILTNL